MFTAVCEYIVFPRKKEFTMEDYIIGKFKTSAENVPVKYRNGKRTVTFTAKGKGIPTNKKFDVLFDGEWKFQEKYGLELYVSKSDIATPSDEQGIKEYLCTFLKGCGPKTAQKIYDRFGQATLMVLQTQPDKLLELSCIRKKQLERMLQSYQETQKYQELASLLSPYGVSKSQIELVVNTLGSNAVDIVKENPFVLDKYRGFSFETLDAMSIRFECMPNDVSRCKSALKHYLKTVMLSGNMYANQYALRENALNVLNSRSDSKVTSAEITNVIWTMYNSHELLGENGNVYLPQSYYYEQQTAKYVVEMLEESRVQKYKTENIEKAKVKSENAFNIELSANQLEAVTMALQNPISIITGGAGTGKTTVLKVVLDCLKRLGEKMDNIILAAPTGKAAIRMTESTGYFACTLHKALGLINDTDFMKDESEIDTIDAPLIVCDEFSMADQFLAYRLFAAADRRNTRILLIGDVGQLPSVGAGKVLNDLIESKKVPVTALNVIFRQAQESNIVKNSHNIYEGVNCFDFSKDFLLYEMNNTEMILTKVLDLFLEEVEKYGLDETVILTPIKKKGTLCTNNLNSAIQELVNPLVGNKVEKMLHGMLFREGDKIMQLKNRTAKNEKTDDSVDICNGDTGYIKSITSDVDGYMFRLVFTGSREVIFSEEDMKQVTLAYAITVHKSQGSEYSSVIMPLHSYMPTNMLTRNLLYTGVTRAKKQLSVVGEKSVLVQAIYNNIANNRNTALADKIISYCYDDTEKENEND